MQDLPFEVNSLNGLSEKLLKSHHQINYGGAGAAIAPAMELALRFSFGSVDRWKEEFAAMGRALGSGSGWEAAAQPVEAKETAS